MHVYLFARQADRTTATKKAAGNDCCSQLFCQTLATTRVIWSTVFKFNTRCSGNVQFAPVLTNLKHANAAAFEGHREARFLQWEAERDAYLTDDETRERDAEAALYSEDPTPSTG